MENSLTAQAVKPLCVYRTSRRSQQQGESALITSIIVEEDELVRLGMKTAIGTNEDIEVIGDYGDTAQMMSELNRLQPDVIILGLDGSESILDRCQTCQEIRRLCPTTNILTLSERQRDEELCELILSGASGCVQMSAGSSEMIRSVGIVADGGLSFDNDALIRLMSRIPKQEQSRRPIGLDDLTEREKAILSLIAGHTNAQIAQKLHVSRSTVKNDLTRIREKLMIRARGELAAYAVRHGISK